MIKEGVTHRGHQRLSHRYSRSWVLLTYAQRRRESLDTRSWFCCCCQHCFVTVSVVVADTVDVTVGTGYVTEIIYIAFLVLLL